MKSRFLLWFVVSLGPVIGASATNAQAEKKLDPSGTWKWSTNVMGQEIETTLKLKLEGEKLTGIIHGDDKEVKIEDARFKDGELSFKALRARSGQELLVKYKGKLTGDAIKGKITVSIGDDERTFDWEAKRVKEEKAKEGK
jgi:hypothetical protein